MTRPSKFNRTAKSVAEEIEGEYLSTLAGEYAREMRRAARMAAAAFSSYATALDSITADANTPPEGEPIKTPKFVAPDIDEVLPVDKLAADVIARTAKTRVKAADATTEKILTRLGMSFDVGGVFSDRLLAGGGARAADLGASVRDLVVKAIEQGVNEGLSVPHTAELIRTSIIDASPQTAEMLARTDLIGITNGGSLEAARQVYPENNVMKVWLATGDERTRETHAEADGQAVPIDQPFEVGGDSLDFPGDPAGSDEEVINCRCTVIYEEVAAVADVPADAPPAITASGVLSTLSTGDQGRLAEIAADMKAAIDAGHYQAAAFHAERERATMVAAVEMMASRPVVVQMPEFAIPTAPAPTVTVNVPEQAAPQVTVEVAAAEAPNVNVTVEAAQVNVPAPVVNVEAVATVPDINVTVEQPVEPVDRQVTFQRDSRGRIVSAEID